MANYVYNRIICTKEVLDKYFLDDEPFEENKKVDEPYITFNKLFNTKLAQECLHVKAGCHFFIKKPSRSNSGTALRFCSYFAKLATSAAAARVKMSK